MSVPGPSENSASGRVRTLRRMRRRPALVEAFWKQSGLFDDVHYIM
jgi:hypothetical protein